MRPHTDTEQQVIISTVALKLLDDREWHAVKIHAHTAHSFHRKDMTPMQVPRHSFLHALDCCSELAVKFEAVSHIIKMLFQQN